MALYLQVWLCLLASAVAAGVAVGQALSNYVEERQRARELRACCGPELHWQGTLTPWTGFDEGAESGGAGSCDLAETTG